MQKVFWHSEGKTMHINENNGSKTPLTDALIEQLNIEPWLSLSTKCAELEAHARQLERRCAELERENAEVMLSDQGRLRSKLASYEGQISKLERENRKWKREHKAMSKGAQTNAEVAKSLCGKLADSKDELAQMKSELAELRRDRERLDWLEKQRAGLECSARVNGPFLWQVPFYTWNHETCRAAIDAAMEDKPNV